SAARSPRSSWRTHSNFSTGRCAGSRPPMRMSHSVGRWRNSYCPAPTKSWPRSAAWRRIEMTIDVTMPQMGESVVEGTITKWLVKEGDVVTEDQPLVEISTDKVDTEIPSPGAGRIAKIVAAERETLPVGAMLAVIEQAGAEAAAKLKVVAPKAAPKPEVAPVQVMPEPVLPPALSPQPMQAAGAGLREAEPEVGGPRRFSPVVLKIAAEEGIDLSRVPGTGVGGGVCKRDLQRYLDSLRKGGVSG